MYIPPPFLFVCLSLSTFLPFAHCNVYFYLHPFHTHLHCIIIIIIIHSHPVVRLYILDQFNQYLHLHSMFGKYAVLALFECCLP